jgi:ribonuclease HI
MIEIYTDGGCVGNGKPEAIGAYAFIVVKDGEIIYEEAVRIEAPCTNNIAELTACIQALDYCHNALIKPINFYSDSNYVIRGINEWLDGWVRNNFKQGDDTRPNAELWKQVVTLRPHFRTLNYIWVKGHDDNIYNNRCDELCTQAMALKPKTKNNSKAVKFPIPAYKQGCGVGEVHLGSSDSLFAYQFSNELGIHGFNDPENSGISVLVPLSKFIKS